MKRKNVTLIALASTAVVLSGCKPGYIRADAVEIPLRAVVERHDAYINTDPDISETERRVALRSSEMLIGILDEAIDTEN